jgi:Ca-activated chloride channel family protein
LPLASTRADIHVAGTIADVTLTQVYRNKSARPLEAIYVFPMSTRAAVHAMKMTIGRRVITAVIKERRQARAVYAAARAHGQAASLLEQDRPNVFRMRVANILPGETVRVELAYVERIVPVEQIYELALPTVVGPRYTRAAAADSAGRGHVPYLRAGAPAPYTFGLAATVESAVPLRALDCPSHAAAQIQLASPRTARITLPDSNREADRDFILRWSLAGGAIESGMLVGESAGQHYFQVIIEPPARVPSDAIVPREYVFIVDVSGSMSGFPLTTAKVLMKELLSGLRPRDRFDILAFSGGNALFAPAPLPATADNVAAASQFMERMEGGGGTELLPALQRALALPRGDAARIVVVITDGYVDVEKEAFELVRRALGQANLFAFGIGSAVNRFLIEGLARAGQGEPFIVTREADAAADARRFLSYVHAPLLRDIRVELHGFAVESLEPPAPPDLFAERPIILCGRYRGDADGTLTVSGRTASGTFVRTLDLAGATRLADGAPLRALWAREQLTWLQELSGSSTDRQAYKEAITRLGLEHHLMTRYTSFVAVDSLARATSAPERVEEPQPLPHGVSNHAVARLASISTDQLDDLLDGDGTVNGKSYGGNLGGLYGGGGGAFGGRAVSSSHVVVGGSGFGAAATVQGTLDKSSIVTAVRPHLSQIHACYQKELAQTPSLQGNLVLQITIGADGSVSAVSLVSSTLGNARVEQCAVTAVRGWTFPQPQGNSSVVIRYPFVLKP